MSQGGRGGFFRGGELRGLVVFAVVMSIGWPVILGYARRKADPPPPPPVVDNRPLEPDAGLAFAGLIDKSPMPSARDNAAFKVLLERARDRPAEEIARKARRDVFYTNLWDRPDLYRGIPIHLEGTLLKTLAHEKFNPEMVPKGRLYEAWFSTPESRPLPYVVMIEDPPPGLTVGIDQNERIVVDAYFLRLLRYTAGDGDRAAPLLIGRARWANADPNSGVPVDAGPPRLGWTTTVFVVGGMIAVYIAIRLIFVVRKATSPSTTRHNSLLVDRPADEIAPEELADWLDSVPDDDHDEPEHS